MNYEEQIAQNTAEIRELKSLLDKPTDELSGREKWLVANFDSELADLKAKDKWLEGEITTERSFRLALATNSGENNLVIRKSKSDEDFIAQNELDLKNSTDLAKFTIYLFEKMVGNYKHEAKFRDSCLELRLDQRRTSYYLDSVNDIKVVLAPSGAGKTRMMLELLYKTFGYYFTVRSSQDDFGSEDLSICMVYCDQDPAKTRMYLSVLYFVRATICNHLMASGFNQAWQILYAQLHPVAFFGHDIFLHLFDSIVNECKIINSQPVIGECFPFLVIDEIQKSLENGLFHSLPESENKRPFFSPLVYYSKKFGKFPQFMVAGTGINFEFIKKILESFTFKIDQITTYQVLSNQFVSLTRDQAAEYTRFVLQEHQVVDCEPIVKRITDFDLCHGRARFVAFVVEWYLRTGDIDQAIAKFLEALNNVESLVFPLRFLKEDIERNVPELNRIVGNDTLSKIIKNGILDFIISGKATLQLRDQNAADAIQYGLGFGKVRGNVILQVQLDELAVIECLRYLIPFGEIVASLAERITSSPKAQMVGYLVEYLVAFALVSNTSGFEVARKIMLSQNSIDYYLTTDSPNVICFPDHMCGADIIYKCMKTKTVYIFQIKFVKGMSKQERVNASDTTDPNNFYCNRKTGEVLKGFEDRIDEFGNLIKGTKSLVLDELLQLQRDGFNIQQVVFVHTGGNQITQINGVQVVSSVSYPTFFDSIGEDLWTLLDSVRGQFK